MHIQKRYLRQPKQKETDHRICGNTLVFGNRIFERQERRPNCSKHDTNGIGSIHGLDGEPEDC